MAELEYVCFLIVLENSNIIVELYSIKIELKVFRDYSAEFVKVKLKCWWYFKLSENQ